MVLTAHQREWVYKWWVGGQRECIFSQCTMFLPSPAAPPHRHTSPGRFKRIRVHANRLKTYFDRFRRKWRFLRPASVLRRGEEIHVQGREGWREGGREAAGDQENTYCQKRPARDGCIHRTHDGKDNDGNFCDAGLHKERVALTWSK